jgi:hypothetical protein
MCDVFFYVFGSFCGDKNMWYFSVHVGHTILSHIFSAVPGNEAFGFDKGKLPVMDENVVISLDDLLDDMVREYAAEEDKCKQVVHDDKGNCCYFIFCYALAFSVILM